MSSITSLKILLYCYVKLRQVGFCWLLEPPVYMSIRTSVNLQTSSYCTYAAQALDLNYMYHSLPLAYALLSLLAPDNTSVVAFIDICYSSGLSCSCFFYQGHHTRGQPRSSFSRLPSLLRTTWVDHVATCGFSCAFHGLVRSVPSSEMTREPCSFSSRNNELVVATPRPECTPPYLIRII